METRSTSSPGVWSRIVHMDLATLRFIRRCETDWVTPFMHLGTRLGNTSSWLLLAILLWFWSPTSRLYFWHMLPATLLATLVAHTLKRTIRRARPSSEGVGFEALSEFPDQYSFPSGHTTTAFAAAAMLLNAPPLVALGAYGTAFWIGTSRIYLGAHYPLDVVMGALLGSTIAFLFM